MTRPRIQVIFGDQEGATYLAQWTVGYCQQYGWHLFSWSRLAVPF